MLLYASDQEDHDLNYGEIMSKITTPKVQKLSQAFVDGKSYTIKQIVSTFKFAGTNSASGRITELRDRGMNIGTFVRSGKPSKYSLANKKSVTELASQGYKLTTP